MRPKPPFSDFIEDHRDADWCREDLRRMETAYDRERFNRALDDASSSADEPLESAATA